MDSLNLMEISGSVNILRFSVVKMCFLLGIQFCEQDLI